MKRAILMAASACAMMATAAVASAAELSVSISEINGVVQTTPITFDFNTAAPVAISQGGVLFAATDANVPDVYNIYFYHFGSGPGESAQFGGVGVGAANGFFTLSFDNLFTSGVTPGGEAILKDPLLGTITVNDAGPGYTTVMTFAQVPEPVTWAVMTLGVFGVGAALRSRKRKAPVTA
jgi:hypothetical protein